MKPLSFAVLVFALAGGCARAPLDVPPPDPVADVASPALDAGAGDAARAPELDAALACSPALARCVGAPPCCAGLVCDVAADVCSPPLDMTPPADLRCESDHSSPWCYLYWYGDGGNVDGGADSL